MRSTGCVTSRPIRHCYAKDSHANEQVLAECLPVMFSEGLKDGRALRQDLRSLLQPAAYAKCSL